MKKAFLLVGFSILVLLSSISVWAQPSLATMDLAVITTNGKSYLYYKEGKEIVIKECLPYVIIEKREDCWTLGDSVVVRVPIAEFKRQMKNQLLHHFDPTAEKPTKKVIAMAEKYALAVANLSGKKKRESKYLESLKEACDGWAQNAKDIEAFAERYGNASIREEDLELWRTATDHCKFEVKSLYGQLAFALTINSKLNRLVDEKISSAKLFTLVRSSAKNTLEYGVLRYFLDGACGFQTDPLGAGACKTSVGVIFKLKQHFTNRPESWERVGGPTYYLLERLPDGSCDKAESEHEHVLNEQERKEFLEGARGDELCKAFGKACDCISREKTDREIEQESEEAKTR